MKNLLETSRLLPALAVVGLLTGIVVIVQGGKQRAVAQPVAEPAAAPFDNYIAGSGILEARTRNIAVSTPVAGVIAEVLVRVGEQVDAGQPLFRLDSRELQAQLAVRQAAVAVATGEALEAEVSLADAHDQLNRAESLKDPRAMSVEDLATRRIEVLRQEARLRAARANAESAAAQVRETRTGIDLHTVHAPMAGTILQVNILGGEYAPTGALDRPLLLMGDMQRLHARVDIDENDAWRFRSGARARGYLRGNTAIAFDMEYEYVEPYVIPKTSLTGASTERVDTRVLQVVFDVPRGDLTIYAGQQVDVYIEIPPRQEARATGARLPKAHWD